MHSTQFLSWILKSKFWTTFLRNIFPLCWCIFDKEMWRFWPSNLRKFLVLELETFFGIRFWDIFWHLNLTQFLAFGIWDKKFYSNSYSAFWYKRQLMVDIVWVDTHRPIDTPNKSVCRPSTQTFSLSVNSLASLLRRCGHVPMGPRNMCTYLLPFTCLT